MYINPVTLSNQSNPAPGLLPLTAEQEAIYLQYNGFVKLTIEDVAVQDSGNNYTVQKRITKLEPDTEAWEAWKASQPSTTQSSYIPTPEQSAVVMMRVAFSAQVADMDDDQIIQCSGLADQWEPGNHFVGEVFNAGDQTWECYQAYDNDVYPDIKPTDPSWYTFNRPLHGKSPETARPFVPVQGAHDMYRSNEYAIWTDGNTYRCKSDTNFSPEDYPDAWEVING